MVRRIRFSAERSEMKIKQHFSALSLQDSWLIMYKCWNFAKGHFPRVPFPKFNICKSSRSTKITMCILQNTSAHKYFPVFICAQNVIHTDNEALMFITNVWAQNKLNLRPDENIKWACFLGSPFVFWCSVNVARDPSKHNFVGLRCIKYQQFLGSFKPMQTHFNIRFKSISETK